MNEDQSKKYREIARAFSLITQLGFTVVVCIVGMTYVGKFLDGKFGTAPIITIVCLLLGIGGACSSTYKTLTVHIRRK
ncbi:MAG: AtpZ/AtpI family protein [Clostridioides sp.]|jgi:F0F1-type ATP synthase assembly protein I|nr:AtpZ/AtpI family protein [Clostridioides sp.]